MKLMTTGLQFGYFLGLLFAVLFWLRGFREERLSDTLLGFVVFFLAMEIQDYTFGFAGINYLWTVMDGWPRHFPWVFPASVFFYLQTQTNTNFKFEQKHLWHLLPYLIYLIVNFVLLLAGKPFRDSFYATAFGRILFWADYVLYWFPMFFYFFKSIKFYQQYLKWTETQFSNIETVSFVWLRNFIYVFVIGIILKLVFSLADLFMNLPYEQDYYWQLFTVCIIAYVGIQGYAQPQVKRIHFHVEEVLEEKPSEDKIKIIEAVATVQPLTDYSDWKPKIERIFNDQKIFLEPELSLSDLAQKLRTNTSVLSAVINQLFNKNFNDFVNEYRVNEFKSQIQLPENKKLTLLAVAFDCGFNSKATFNRAIKKNTGLSPKELMGG